MDVAPTCLTEVEDHRVSVLATPLLHFTPPYEFPLEFLRMTSQLHLGAALHHYPPLLLFCTIYFANKCVWAESGQRSCRNRG